MEQITRFWSAYFFLSNFYITRVIFEDVDYPSVENAYQAAKTLDEELRKKFTDCTPGEAKKLGNRIKIRPDWEQVKFDIMFELLKQKFSHPRLRKMLLDTGDAKLIEGNTWGDTIWGCIDVGGEWVGENHLGKMQMKIRSELYENMLTVSEGSR